MSENVIAYYTNPTPESGIFDVGIQAIHQYTGENTYVGFSISYYDDLDETYYNLQSNGLWSTSGDYNNLKIITGDIGASGTAYLQNVPNTARKVKIGYYDNSELINSSGIEYIQRSNFSYGYNGNIGKLNLNSNNNGYYIFNPFGN